jgi:Zn-dependent M28 family amino/carboxypeptidase
MKTIPSLIIAYAFITLFLTISCNPTNQAILPASLPTPTESLKFDGEQAYKDVVHQVDLGPRIPGRKAHQATVKWIQSELEKAQWGVEIQETQLLEKPIKNVIAKRESTTDQDRPWIILGAHYDTRLIADQDPDPDAVNTPVPGANDGASGVAVLLELGRKLPINLPVDIWLVFFDAEDNGRISGWDWILGSRAFVENLQEYPDAAVIVDMVGDADLNLYIEKNSEPELVDSIWKSAEELGYSNQFINIPKHSMLDDHTPFLEAGIPAVDIIDFDYPYWHTTADTSDKVSATSLQIVGDTLLNWVMNYKSP